jgi:hypothetical protein
MGATGHEGSFQPCLGACSDLVATTMARPVAASEDPEWDSVVLTMAPVFVAYDAEGREMPWDTAIAEADHAGATIKFPDIFVDALKRRVEELRKDAKAAGSPAPRADAAGAMGDQKGGPSQDFPFRAHLRCVLASTAFFDDSSVSRSPDSWRHSKPSRPATPAVEAPSHFPTLRTSSNQPRSVWFLVAAASFDVDVAAQFDPHVASRALNCRWSTPSRRSTGRRRCCSRPYRLTLMPSVWRPHARRRRQKLCACSWARLR